MRLYAFIFLIIAIICDVNQNYAMRIKRGDSGRAHGSLTENENDSSHNAKRADHNRTHRSLEINDMNKEQVCSISNVDDKIAKNLKKSTHENNLKDFNVNIIKSELSADKPDEGIKIFLVDSCEAPAPTQNNDKLQKHEIKNADNKFKNSNLKYTEEANKHFKQDSLKHSKHLNKFANKDSWFNNGEKFRSPNHFFNKYTDNEFTKGSGNLINLYDDRKLSGEYKKAAHNRPLLKYFANYKPYGDLQSPNSEISNMNSLNGVFNYANMLLYGMDKDTGLRHNLGDKESCMAKSQELEDLGTVGYLYHAMDPNVALYGTRNRALYGNSPLLSAPKYFTNNEPSSLNFIENAAIDSIFSTDSDGEINFDVHCPVHAPYKINNKKNADGIDDGIVQVCSCRLYKKN